MFLLKHFLTVKTRCQLALRVDLSAGGARMAGIGGVFLWLRLQSRQRILSALESLNSIYGRANRRAHRSRESGCPMKTTPRQEGYEGLFQLRQFFGAG